MAQALHTIGLLVDPAIGRDLNALQRSRDKWRGRAKAAEGVSQLDRTRANTAARSSAAAWGQATELQRQLDAQSEGLEAARDRAERLQRTLDIITTWAEDGDRIDDPGARAVLGMIRQDDET